MTIETDGGGHHDHPGERAARDALRESVEKNSNQMQLANESRELLTSYMRTELRDELRIAFAEGVQAALTSEEMWAQVFKVLQKQAAQRTGRFLLHGAAAAFRQLVWLALFVGIGYSLGGWTMAKAVWGAMTRGSAAP